MYLKWDEKVITVFSDSTINSLYNEGYLFGRVEKGEVYQTRSLRIDLAKFKLSSENKRVLKKTDGLKLTPITLPYADYHWGIGKLAKDFYETKFGEGTFSANKVKELLTDESKSNFNRLFLYERFVIPTEFARVEESLRGNRRDSSTTAVASARNDNTNSLEKLGYCIVRETDEMIHYCYPFYKLDTTIPNTGLGMMLNAIVYAQSIGKKYVYLGSFSRPTDTYKLQFEGLEWFDGKQWQTDFETLKKVL